MEIKDRLDKHVLNYLVTRGYTHAASALHAETHIQPDKDDNFLIEWFQVLNEYKHSHDADAAHTATKTTQLERSYELLAIEQRKLHRTQQLEQDKLKVIASRYSSANVPNPHSFQ
ncbi:hypothetical protein E3P99_03336 [Wallemia hederae]|uniref:Uncharacterized protein n=1 Tax=Wallemia hederae TaxID=1540922 RepID=A0A4T0FGL8_9BASI|nr:hypothetical protein E3P99_03336 [Wallemia hederae]